METKICTKCKNVLPLEKFALNKAKKMDDNSIAKIVKKSLTDLTISKTVKRNLKETEKIGKKDKILYLTIW